MKNPIQRPSFSALRLLLILTCIHPGRARKAALDNNHSSGSPSISSPQNSHRPNMDFSKLTVPALKALCKERKITGYSKLGKQALIDKLRAAELATSTGPTATATKVPKHQDSIHPSSSNSITPSSLAPPEPPTDDSTAPQDSNFHPHTSTPQKKDSRRGPEECSTSEGRRFDMLPPPTPVRSGRSVTPTGGNNHTDSTTQPALPHLKNPANENPNTSRTPPQSSRVSATDALTSPTAAQSATVVRPQNITTTFTAGRPQPLPRTAFTSTSLNRAPPVDKLAEEIRQAKRPKITHTFKPPLTTSRISVPPAYPTPFAYKPFKPLSVTRPPAYNPPKSILVNQSPTPFSAEVETLYHFDFQPCAPATFMDVTMPPPLSRRKLISRMAIILSGLSNSDRRACVFVCRAWRYAGQF